MIASVLLSALYIYLLFLAPEPVPLLVLKVTVLLMVLLISGVLGWMGYVLSTSGSPEEVESLIRELEEKGELSSEGE